MPIQEQHPGKHKLTSMHSLPGDTPHEATEKEDVALMRVRAAEKSAQELTEKENLKRLFSHQPGSSEDGGTGTMHGVDIAALEEEARRNLGRKWLAEPDL